MEVANHLKAIEPGHAHIEEGEVRALALDERKPFDPVHPFAHDHDLREAGEQVNELVPRRRLIVNHDNAQASSAFSSLIRAGIGIGIGIWIGIGSGFMRRGDFRW
jgi:hypothetical protein